MAFNNNNNNQSWLRHKPLTLWNALVQLHIPDIQLRKATTAELLFPLTLFLSFSFFLFVDVSVLLLFLSPFIFFLLFLSLPPISNVIAVRLLLSCVGGWRELEK